MATARAGNVIGGGDFSSDRIIPDYFRSLLKNQKLILRSPNSIRPWQHVLDPLYGYLLLLMKLDKKQIVTGSSFNFGPNRSSNKTVNEVINLINRNLNNDVKIIAAARSNCMLHLAFPQLVDGFLTPSDQRLA